MTNTTANVIPETLDEITKDWLSAAMQEISPGIKAIAVEVIDAHSGTTGRARLKVSWEGGDLPAHIFAKFPPTDEFQRMLSIDTGMGMREAHFYQTLAKDVPVRVPRPLLSKFRDDGQAYIMLIEDLATAGCDFPDVGSSADINVARNIVGGLAKIHAAFWESPRFQTDLSWIEPPMHSEFGPQLVAGGVSNFGASQPEAFHQVADIYVNHGDAVAHLMEQGPTTLLHGDSHMGNLFLDKQDVGFLDWACVSKGPSLRDFAYFLCASVDTELRRAEQQSLLKHYIDVLASNGGPSMSFDAAWRDYRRFVTAGWIAAVATLSVGAGMQSIEVGERAVARANAAVEDLDTANLLREELGL